MHFSAEENVQVTFKEKLIFKNNSFQNYKH